MLSVPLTAPSEVAWATSPGLIPYDEAVATMEQRVQAIITGRRSELVWLLEHPPIYTAGTSAKEADLIDPRFPVHRTGRGGQFTYHGPGQRVAYVMLDLRRRRQDVRAFVRDLEEWMIRALASLGVTGERRRDRVGIWVTREGGREEKIGAIGVRLRHWVTFHGISLNVAPDLTHFSGIVPCGVTGHGITSLADLGIATTMRDLDASLEMAFEEIFGPVQLTAWAAS